MSQDTLPEQRTEMPTDRRMGELRKEGHIFHSYEVAQVLSLMTGFFSISWMCNWIFSDLKMVMIRAFELTAQTEPIEFQALQSGFIKILLLLGPKIFLMILCTALVYGLSVMLQTNWNVKEKWVKFNWNFLNPIGGIMRIVSLSGFITVGKAILKLALILPISYFGLQALAPQMVMLIHSSIPDVMALTGKGITSLFWKILYILIAMAIFDYCWGKWRWLRQNKMTKDEVKDERKAVEGDETMRRKMIAKGMQRLASRIKMSVPKANVVITNPTHFAIALQYERGKNNAPVVVAKGADFLALRIREIAKEHNIPIVERKALARALYASTDVGKEIPRDLFKAVAEVLAFVFRLKNPGARAQSVERR